MGACGALAVLGAPALVTAAAIRLTMGPPILFRQERPGLGGRPFTLLKFRTMHPVRGSTRVPGDDEERLTKVGAILRRTSLDEVPQLLNVLRGDMSLVGPRPLLMEYLDRYTPEQSRRHLVKPGITGWAQVNGRNAISWEEKFALDVWYVDHWSLRRDLKILWLTLGQVARRVGISREGHATTPDFIGDESSTHERAGSRSLGSAAPRRRANVLLLIKGLGRGGAEYIVSRSATFGDRSRFHHEVAFVLPWKTALVDELGEAGIPVHCIGRGPAGGRSWPGRLRSLVIDRDIDLIHAHSPVAAAAARVLVGHRRVRHIYTEHNVWERYRPVTRWADALTFGRNDHVFAVSKDVRRSIESSWLGRRCPAVETLVHGIDPDFASVWASSDEVRSEFGIEPDAPLVVTVANFKPFKGHEHLLRAAALVRKGNPEARFLLAGVGATEPQMKRLASDLGLDGSVVFSGFRDDAPRLMAAADLFVLPSEHEGLPIALLEAMALGRASLVTAVGGMPEVVRDGRDAFVVPPADPQALAEGIVTLLDDDELRRRIGEAARIRATDFDIRTAINRMEEVYEELLS